MLAPRKLVIYLICAIAVITVFTAVLGKFAWPVLMLALFTGLLVEGLVVGELSIGRGGATWKFHRHESPIRYWCVALLYAAVWAALAADLFTGGWLSKHA
jgi:hypothetical protein